jgi:hypothetical protein
VTGDTDDQGGEQERGDNRTDEPEKDLAEHPQRDGNVREIVADSRPDDHRHQDPGRHRAAPDAVGQQGGDGAPAGGEQDFGGYRHDSEEIDDREDGGSRNQGESDQGQFGHSRGRQTAPA